MCAPTRIGVERPVINLMDDSKTDWPGNRMAGQILRVESKLYLSIEKMQ